MVHIVVMASNIACTDPHREYCEADDRWEEPCKFLAEGGGAGWDLLGQMMARDWRARPSVEACLEHPFRTGKALA